MSLFGQASSAPSSGSSLFSSLNLASGAEQPAKKRSIFDPPTAASQAQPQAAPSLFGPTPVSSSANPLFGAAVTTAGPTSSVFGNPTTTTGSAQQGGMFSGLGQSNAQQPAMASSLFGATSQPTSSSLFGATSSQSTLPNPQGQSQTRDPATFSSLLERQKKKARFANGNQSGRISQLPSLAMDLGDLARRAQEIGGRGLTTSSVTGADSRAHYLLAGSGVSPGKAYKDFQTLEREDVGSEYKEVEPFDPRNETFIRNLQQRGREAMIRENMDRVNAEFDAFLEESLNINFDEQKQRIMEHFGLVSKAEDANGDASRSSPAVGKGNFGKSVRKSKNAFVDSLKGSSRSVFGKSAMEKSMIGTPGMGASTISFFAEEAGNSGHIGVSRGQSERHLREKERFFVEKVEQLNQVRLQDQIYPLLQHFGQVESSAGGDTPSQLVDAYDALREITNENSQAVDRSDPAAIKERQYAATYLDEHSNTPKVIKLRRQILDGSRSHLEKSFFREIEGLIEKNPREAQLGGRPTVMNKIRAYIRLRSGRRDLAPDGVELQQIGENGEYCWVLIFYLIRCGYVREAAEYVSNDLAFQSTDKRFISYLTTYAKTPDRRLSRKLQEMINGEYQQRLRIAPENSVDPYRMACYKIVGRCDLSRRHLDVVGQGVEDWVWLQFCLARELDRIEELSGEIFGLEQICETVREIGQKHFQKVPAEVGGGYGTYFYMQILAGMFEQAVAYLHAHNPVSSVHFAIALAYYGLLRVSDFAVAGNELLTYSTTQRPLINFVPLVAYHTATFRTALPVAAVDYLSLICLNSDLTPASLGTAQTSACHECLRQLCLETREFAKLLGDIRRDGTRIAGAIEQKARLIKLNTHDDFLKAVTIQAAAIADERGQVADAVLLFHLCEDYDSVVGVLNRCLADAVNLDLGESPMQLQPLKPLRLQQDQESQDGRHSKGDVPISSLSLTQSTSSPVDLARNMMTLYNSNAAYYNLISPSNRKTLGALLQLLNARSHLEASPPRYMDTLEGLNSLNILPLKAGGSIPAIRSAAAAFGALPQILARCAGVSVVWAITAIGGERENVARHGGWDTGYGNDKESMKEQLSSMAKDLMVFAGLVKYKLPARVYDMLTRVGGDVGAY